MSIKELFIKASTEGLKLPYAYDPVLQRPSVTLFFSYVTFVLAIVSTIALHFTDKVLVGTTSALIFWIMSTVFYLLRNLSKAKVDLDDKSFEFDSGQQTPEGAKNE